MEKSLTLDELKKLVMAQAAEKGFGVRREDVNVAEKFVAIHSEISKAFGAHQRNGFDGEHGVGEYMGDAVQRIFHLAGVIDVDIEADIVKKFSMDRGRG